MEFCQNDFKLFSALTRLAIRCHAYDQNISWFPQRRSKVCEKNLCGAVNGKTGQEILILDLIPMHSVVNEPFSMICTAGDGYRVQGCQMDYYTSAKMKKGRIPAG
jgi:hypothetical protein